VISGLLLSQASAALAAYRGLGFVLQRRIVLDGWATLILARPATRLVRSTSIRRGAELKRAHPALAAIRIVKRRRQL
jgi:hypothetical protein